MIVSDTFKKNIQSFGKRISLKLVIGDKIFINDEIISCTKSFEGDMFKSIMQYVDVELQGLIDVKDKEVNISFGVCKEEPYEYIDWGSFIIDNDSIVKSIDKNSTKFTAYDYLCKSSIDYVDLGIKYPISVGNYLKVICDYLGYNLATTNFVNSEKTIDEDPYLGLGYTFRDVLNQIAQVAAAVIVMKGNNLYVKYPTDIGFVMDENNLKSLSVYDRFGPINSVVLSLEPQEDNYYKKNDQSVNIDGLTEIKMSNNEIMYDKRDVFIEEIYQKLNGFYFYPFNSQAFGYAFFEPYDQIVIENKDGNSYQTVILSNSIKVTTGLSETISTDKPESTTTNYSKASKEEKELYRTILAVDKQNQQIKTEVSKKVGDNEIISKINQTAEQIKIQANRLSLEGTITADGNVKILEDGSIKVKNGKFNGTIEGSSFNTVKRTEYTYTEEDLDILSELIRDAITPTEEQLLKYDIDLNGVIGATDLYHVAMVVEGRYGETGARAVIEDIISLNLNGSGKIVLERRINDTRITMTEFNGGSINKIGGNIMIDGEPVITSITGTIARFG